MILKRTITTYSHFRAERIARGIGFRVLVWVFDEGRKNAYDQIVEIVELVWSDNNFFYARLLPSQEVFAFPWGISRLFYFVKEQ